MSNLGTGVHYSVIYYIHADADYLYHTSDGQPVRGNAKVLDTALKVGNAARSGEVFIFYQMPEKKILGLFPRKSSRLFLFKNGQLINHVKYRHSDTSESFLSTEAKLMHQYRAYNRSEHHQNFFLYFGHEIPSENGTGYHRSLPGIDVNTITFATGIQNFLESDDDRFELTVLSTCNNGTPAMAEQLIPFTQTMLASPQNLHLSHFDSASMNLLEKEPGITSIQLGHSMAEKTYQRLEETVHTTITLALYNFEDIQDYIQPLSSLTSSIKVPPDRSLQFQDNVDCAELSFIEIKNYQEGVETWYKPAHFGRPSGQNTHSGWGCKPSLGN